ncbi:MAG: hypothetical protein V4773_15485, partial [Verrucomicrobiota bacterium]
MIARWLLLLLLLFTGAAARAQDLPESPFGERKLFGYARGPAFSDFRFQRGDDVRWAAADFDDSSWASLEGRELPSRAGIYWVRWRARQPDLREFRLRDGLLFKMVASYDVYW